MSLQLDASKKLQREWTEAQGVMKQKSKTPNMAPMRE
jgi:hypothetical protein